MKKMLLVLALLAPAAAFAQEVTSTFDAHAARHTGALELAIGAGPTGGYGHFVSNGATLQDMGLGLDATIGYRLDPRWMVGTYASTALFPTGVSGRGESLSASAGLQAAYHFGAPWISVGAGWHGYWLSNSPDGRTAFNGLDLVRLQAGVEVPVSPSFSIEPYAGMTVTTFLTEKAPTAAAATDVNGKSTSVFLMAGALARFELFGRKPSTVLARN